jgi:prepilin-type processing-associated H-X9-DG protein
MNSTASARRRRSMLAFSLVEVMVVSAIVTSIPAAQYARAKQKAYEVRCMQNLQQIGQLVTMFHDSEGTYPDAVFFPSDALNDPKSIVKVLENAGYPVPPEMWICPGAPLELAARKLTFVYNDKCAGRADLKAPNKAWLLVEVNCVSKSVPPPHPGGYNVLCADGHVVTTAQLPSDLVKLQQAALPGVEPATSNRLARWLWPGNTTARTCAAR